MISASVGRAGVTLVELIVTLALLAIVAGIVTVSFTRSRPGEDRDPALRTLVTARREAIAAGHPVTVLITSEGRRHAVTALPDGRVLADTIFAVDPLSGGRMHGTR